MKVNSGAKSYAHAFFELAHDQNQTDALCLELKELSALFLSSPEFQSVIQAARITPEQKKQLLRNILEKTQVSSLTRNLTLLLTDRNRLSWLPQIAVHLQELTDGMKHILRGTVTTAENISDDQIKDLERAFSKKFGKGVALEAKQDRTLLGGLVVQIRDLTFDGSLKSSLARLKNTLERQYV